MKKLGLIIMSYGITCLVLSGFFATLSTTQIINTDESSSFLFTGYTVIWKNGTKETGYIIAPSNTTFSDISSYFESRGDYYWLSIP